MGRVSDHFNLGRTQASLEFVDVDVRRDTPLFIDPGAIRLIQSPLANACRTSIQSFFSSILALISSGEDHAAQELMSALGEPNETHLGLSKGTKSAGRGVGDGLAEGLWSALSESKAVSTGVLHDLEETALFIEGIDRDIISDIVTNLIREQLALFTEAMAVKYSISVEPSIVQLVWDPRQRAWTEKLFSLPVVDGVPLLLVPRPFVRRSRAIFSAERYYRHYIMPMLQVHHLNAGTSLVRLLRDGKTRRPPYKKTLMAMEPHVKATNVKYTDQDPSLLAQYTQDARREFAAISHGDLARGVNEPEPDFDAMLDKVLAVPPGAPGADAYHRAVETLLTALFYPALDFPQIEYPIYDGRKRIDIDYTNIAGTGFFHWIHVTHNTTASYIPVECKNYSSAIKNPELDQLTGRFSAQRGWLGILCYRGFDDKNDVAKRCHDAAQSGRGYVIALDDDDLRELVRERKTLETGEEFQLLRDRFKALVS